MHSTKMPVAASFGVFVTLSLFLLMSVLIDRDPDGTKTMDLFSNIHFGPVEIPDDVDVKDRVPPPEFVKPKPLPPTPVPQVTEPQDITIEPFKMDLPAHGVKGGEWFGGGPPGQSQGSDDGALRPLVTYPPLFPHNAALNGNEGWVLVEFTVTPLGTVADARVIDADPRRIFDRAALRAISKWKFEPRMIDGLATSQTATQRFEFRLDGLE